MTITRPLLRRAVLASGAAACIPGALPAPAIAQGALKKVRIALGTTVMNLTYPWLTIPVALGWWRDEGYDVEVLPVGASLQCLQQLVAGNVELAQMNSSVVIQANVQNDIPVRVVMNNGILDWALAALQDGPIREPKDFKGSTVGVFSLATGGIAFMKSYFHSIGIDADKDVHLIPLGLGAPPVQALRDNQVQSLLYWGSALGSFENAGLKLRYFAGDDWATYPDFTLSTLQKTMDSDPAMLEIIARGAAKASVYVMENPDCQRRIHWAKWPNTKPSGADEATLIKYDMNNLGKQLSAMRGAFEMNGGKLWGRATPEAYGRMQQFMVQAGLIEKTLDPTVLMPTIPDFFQKINDFDAAAVRAQAAACRI